MHPNWVISAPRNAQLAPSHPVAFRRSPCHPCILISFFNLQKLGLVKHLHLPLSGGKPTLDRTSLMAALS